MAGTRRQRLRLMAAREALWIALIAVATTAIALGVVYFQTVRVVEAQMRAVVDGELQTLLEVDRNDGHDALRQTVTDAVDSDKSGNDFFYLLAAGDGSRLAGNLTRWPVDVPPAGWSRFTVRLTSLQGPYTRQIDALAVRLSGGNKLLVGHLAEGRLRIRDRFLTAVGVAAVLSTLFGLLFGYWRTRRALAFIAAMNDTGDRFLAGSLKERLPVTRHGDEYDRLSETVNAAFDATQNMVESLRAVTDGMAHDLKTPLTRIQARLELAQMRAGEGSAFDELFQETDKDLRALLGLIDGMLRLARAEATSVQSFVALDLATLARDMAELYAPVAEDKGVLLTLATDAAPVRGSSPLLTQLVANLLDNAIKYTPAGGRVRLATGSEGDQGWLTVADTGPGIAPEDRARVLTRFVRLDASRQSPGVGLGLSLVDTIVRVHGGRLTLADNAPGLRVDVRMPRG
ncbi:sensor histidine kinase [Sandaracinobacteroides saxicola]|uniref:histidine kinase n=1 Tax=Sandaracinobacteroides saxicola TaxID=2759707 RepID=A0A7G5IKC8_9SPHN|nr:ATP-binding protein [Sandaracinobacteroides saxicola]QMW23820.1 two-component sensor histidine kinase [Sandaracinobacteroides saxicola]